MLIKAKLDSLQDTGIDHHALLKQFDHLNHLNPDKFESTDLDMLIKAATSDLEHYDKARHEEFKKYEMMKEHERREYLKTLNEEKRKEEESKFEEMKKKHENHPKVNHPLEKVYDPKNEEDDMVEMEEERLRMREHVMNETLDQQQFFTEEELKEYENLISVQEIELKKKADELQKQKEELQPHPVSSLFLEKVKDNEDRHILCKSTGFYPENINIMWKRWTQKDLQYQEVSEGIITGPTVKNEDGTFNVTSYLSLRPALEDSVTSYQCVVWHVSLLTGQSFNLTLPLTSKHPPGRFPYSSS
ncbi:Nucleobindin 2 precursor isoform 2-like protein [Camelus ferus]|nr:Nucleobindin 2 precursor isoform 2-like protein [Camelus ferus]